MSTPLPDPVHLTDDHRTGPQGVGWVQDIPDGERRDVIVHFYGAGRVTLSALTPVGEVVLESGLVADGDLWTVTVPGPVRGGYLTCRTGAVEVFVTVQDPTAMPGIVGYGYPAEGVFGPGSEITRDVSGAPLHPDSAVIVNRFLYENLLPYYSGVAAFNNGAYSTAVVQVDHSVPEVTVGFRDYQGKEYVPSQLYPGGHFTRMPIPDGVAPAAGTDAQLTVLRREYDGSWLIGEFWKAARDAVGTGNHQKGKRMRGVTGAQADAALAAGRNAGLTANETYPGWSAVWGGRLNTREHPQGWFPDGMGSSATGLVTSALSVNPAELAAGRITHAISLLMFSPGKGWSWPAQRSDGSNASAAAPLEGQRFVMDPAVDYSRIPMHPVARLIVEAALVLGFIVTDRAGCVGIAAESSGVRGVDRWAVLLDGRPSYLVMRGFPWEHVLALPRDFGRPVA